MQEVPHLVKMHAKYGSKGFNVIGVTDDEPNAIAKMAKDKSANYLLVKSNAFFLEGNWDDPGRGVIYLVGPDGKVMRVIEDGKLPTDAEIEGWIANIVPRVVPKSLRKVVEGIGKTYDKGEYGKAAADIEKLLAKDGTTDSEKEDATYVKDLIDKQVAAAAAKMAQLEEQKEYSALLAWLDAAGKQFKDLPLAAELEKKKKEIKDNKDLKTLIAALTELDKLADAMWTAKDDKALEAAKTALRTFAAKNRDNHAGEKALALVK